MALVVPNQGEEFLGRAAVGMTAAATPWVLRLYVNNVTPANTHTELTFTEASGGGYAAVTLTLPSAWSITPGSPTLFAYPLQTFEFTGSFSPISVYGYYVTDSVGHLLFAERLAEAPFIATTPGDSVDVTPQLTFASVNAD